MSAAAARWQRRDLVDLLLLAALWGASFLFMRMGAGEFGPLALSFVRVAGATAFLLPLLAWQGGLAALRTHAAALAVVGIGNSALPFVAFSLATLAISGGLAAIFNATSPLWATVVAWAWLGQRPGGWRVLGLAIGFAGVAWLAAGKGTLLPGSHGVSAGLAIGACLLATACYGFSATYTRQRLAAAPPLAVAAGSQLAAALVLALPAAWAWPAVPPSATAWAAASALALLCTGLAYVLYFRLIARVGPGNAITVTFLVPAFAVLWGWLVLGEPLTARMAAGCAVILAGTALATGLLPRRKAAAAAAG